MNLLQLQEGEKISDCLSIRDFSAPDHYLIMATKKGLVKKTNLSDYGRPRKGGIIAIKLRDDDELIHVMVTKKSDDIILSTASGMAIRFKESDARPMGRNTSGVKGISLSADDYLVGMVVADPEATLLTACENGYGKRTLFGPNEVEDGDDETSSSNRYRTQKRGGKGVRDIKTTKRNGPVIGIVPVVDTDEILLMTSRGKLQRIACNDINTIGRNTQGVRIMSMDEGDNLSAIVRVPRDEPDGQAEDGSGESDQPDGEPVAKDIQADSDAKSDPKSDAKPGSGPNDSEQDGPDEASEGE